MDVGSNNDDEAETFGSHGKGELKGYMAGLHSPFGIIGQMKEKFGYTHQYVMWGQPWALFVLEGADAPRYVRGNPPVPVVDNTDDLQAILGGRAKKIKN